MHSVINEQGYVSKEDYQKLQTGEITAPDFSKLPSSSNEKRYQATWVELSPIVHLAGYLTYIISMFDDQCFNHLNDNDCDQVMLNKYHQWMNNLDNNIRLVFAFDN